MKTATPAAVEVGYDTAKQVSKFGGQTSLTANFASRKQATSVGRYVRLCADGRGYSGVPERAGAKLVLAQLEQVRHWFSRLVLIWVDGGYSGTDLRKWVMDTYRWVFETVLRTDKVKGFVPIPQRWKVERTFGWFNWCRRLSKDYEILPETSEAFIYIANIRLMLRRLA